MAADRIDFQNFCAAAQKQILRFDFIFQCDPLDGIGQKCRASAAADGDKQIIRLCLQNEVDHFLRSQHAFLIRQRVPADINVGVAVVILLLFNLDANDSLCDPFAQNVADSLRHGIARLSCAKQVNVPLAFKVPALYANMQHVAFHMHDVPDPLIGVHLL